MRRAVSIGVISGMLAAGTVAVSGSAAVPPGPSAATGQQRVEYRGLHIPVPAGWAVYDLSREPSRCVRFDQNAIYLGAPGDAPDCPTRLVGRTEAIHLEPLAERMDGYVSGFLDWVDDRTASPSLRRSSDRRLSRIRVRRSVAQDVGIALPEAGVRITATYETRPGLIQTVLRSIRPAPGASRLRNALPARHPTVEKKEALPRRRHWARGRGFDTCTAPSARAMRAWRPYFVAANIYIGGAARACGDGHLSRGWVRAVRRMGWRLIPTYVGLQAPCSRYRSKIKRKYAAAQGRQSADNAIAKARAFGLRRRTPIYFDIEAYDGRKAKCRRAVLDFLHAWTKRLHRKRYVSGVYSSVLSAVRDLGYATGIRKPRSIWFAHWDKKATRSSKYMPGHWWSGHRRIKQFHGPHKEKHGGIKMNIDSDYVDGHVH